MSYQVLARKWRPRTFESLVGQEHVVRALTHALTDQRLHHAYLFTGTRGVGKTTLARILAKSLNCETGVTAKPCGVCSACTEIDSGRFVDLLEVDAATNTKVDEMRQLLENAVYAPTRGRFKVYVIDEVHMLSNSAFNAMLKTLEEPPEHVKFILATTDPQKIPVTVLSRCLQFNLKQMTPPLIAGHLKHILDVEAIAAEVGALNLIARSAAGSMRDALSLLDQAIAHGAGQVEEAQVRDMLGTVDLDYLFTLLDALLAGDAAAMLQVADDMATRSLSFESALQELAALLTRIQVAQLAPQAIADDLPERERILALAAQMDAESVQLAYQIAIHGRKELSLAPDEQAGFVMTLLRLHAFRPVEAGAVPVMPPPSASKKEARNQPVVQRTPEPPVAAVKTDAALDQVSSESTGEVSEGGNDSVLVEARAIVPVQDVPISDEWHQIVPALGLAAMARALAQHCELRQIGEARVHLCLAPEHKHLNIKPAQEKLQQALSSYFGRPIQLAITLEEAIGETPAVVAQRERHEMQGRAVAAIEQDGFVREVIDTLGGSLIEASIKPIQ